MTSLFTSDMQGSYHEDLPQEAEISIDVRGKDIDKFDKETLQVYLASYLSKKFGVSFVAMQSILNFDNRNNN